MLELLIGFALGGLAFTEKGHEVGNRIFDKGINTIKKMAKEVKLDENNRETVTHD
jgi:hypothetical protein